MRLTLQSIRSILTAHRACTAFGIPMADHLTHSPLSSDVPSWAAPTKSSRYVRYTLPWKINIPGTKRLVTHGRCAPTVVVARSADGPCAYAFSPISL